MARAALAFLATLDPRRARQATFPFGHAERLNWHYVPRRREGLPLKDMTRRARAAAHALLQAGLSAAGYAKARTSCGSKACSGSWRRSGASCGIPTTTLLTVFGTPGPGAPWGWRFEGHHLSLNFTIVPGRAIAVTPAFLGANPAEVRSGPLQGLRALQAEQDLGLALARSLDSGAARARATIADVVAGGHRQRPGPRRRPEGARRSAPRRPRRRVAGARPAAPRDLRAQHAQRPGGERAAADPRRRDRARPLRLGRADRSRRDPTTTASTGRPC